MKNSNNYHQKDDTKCMSKYETASAIIYVDDDTSYLVKAAM